MFSSTQQFQQYHPQTTICVTGATSFIASHIIKKLLEQGHNVRATARDPKSTRCDFLREIAESETVKKAGGTLTLFKCDLTEAGSFDEAFSNGCEVVIHTAAVVKTSSSDPWNEIISPSVEGASEVARSAAKFCSSSSSGSLHRIVQTSSISAVHQRERDRHPEKQYKPFDETEWRMDLRPNLYPYEAAKSLSERAVNEIFPGSVISILPSFTIGPMLSSEVRSSLTGVKLFANRELPFAPSSRTSFVDVRDVADAHIAAAFLPKFSLPNNNRRNNEQKPQQRKRVERFICSQRQNRPLADIATSINKSFPHLSPPTWMIPKFGMWCLSWIDGRISSTMLEERLIERPDYDTKKIQTELDGFQFRFSNDLDVMVKDCVESMITFGIVAKK